MKYANEQQDLVFWLLTKVLSCSQVRSTVLRETRPPTCPVSACRAARAAPTAGMTHPAWCRRMAPCGSLWSASRVCAWCWTWPAWWWSTTSGGGRWAGEKRSLWKSNAVNLKCNCTKGISCDWKCKGYYYCLPEQYDITRQHMSDRPSRFLFYFSIIAV